MISRSKVRAIASWGGGGRGGDRDIPAAVISRSKVRDRGAIASWGGGGRGAELAITI